jgi:uncharacterized protein (TIGR01777 family)
MGSRILISGASGLVGSALVPALEDGGAEVVRLTRNSARGSAPRTKSIPWDPAHPISPEAVSGFDVVIHLAGESVLGRWSEAKKARIRGSRVQPTTNLARALGQARQKPRVFLSASAIGFYGNRGEELLTEDTTSGSGFAAELSRDWEAAALPATEAGIRTAQMRMGIILGENGGALQTMLPPFKMGLGGRLGDGHQWMSWIDVQDVVGAIQHLMSTEQMRGPVNMVAPGPVTNTEFTKKLGGVLSRPTIFPVPGFAVRLAFGQMADELLLASQKVQPARLLSSGYVFRYPELRASLERILKH